VPSAIRYYSTVLPPHSHSIVLTVECPLLSDTTPRYSPSLPLDCSYRSRIHKAGEDVDVLPLIDDAALGSRTAWWGSWTGWVSLCRWVTLVQELNGCVCVIGEEAEEAAGEANRKRYRHLGKHARSARRQVVRVACAVALNAPALDIGGHTYAKSGRTPATIFFLSLPQFWRMGRGSKKLSRWAVLSSAFP
jgi:hypothetical protein